MQTVKDSILERYPESKPWSEFLSERMGDMKLRKWVVLLLVAIGIAGSSGYLGFKIGRHYNFSVGERSSAQSSASQPASTQNDYPAGNWSQADKNKYDLACRFVGAGRAEKDENGSKAIDDYEKGYVGLFSLAKKHSEEKCWQDLSSATSNLANAYTRNMDHDKAKLASQASIEIQTAINHSSRTFSPDKMNSAERLYEQLTNSVNSYAR